MKSIQMILYTYFLIEGVTNNNSSIDLKVDEYFGYISTFKNDPMEIFKVGNMRDGKKHGEWLITFPDTKRLLLKEEYNNGIKEGNWIEYDGNNWKIEEGEYSNNTAILKTVLWSFDPW